MPHLGWRPYPVWASAADGDEWYVVPFLGGTVPDYRRDADHDSLAYGLDVGHELGPWFNIELSADGVDPHLKGPVSGHLNLDSLSLDMLAVANREGVVSPYVGLDWARYALHTPPTSLTGWAMTPRSQQRLRSV